MITVDGSNDSEMTKCRASSEVILLFSGHSSGIDSQGCGLAEVASQVVRVRKSQNCPSPIPRKNVVNNAQDCLSVPPGLTGYLKPVGAVQITDALEAGVEG